MNKTLNEKKGITLVALVITIIVLLILAVVTISALQNDGIIKYAQNATDIYQFAEEKEDEMLTNYADFVEQYATGGKDTDGDIQLKDDEITFKVLGETYVTKKNMTWEQWIASDYNTIKARWSDNIIFWGEWDNNNYYVFNVSNMPKTSETLVSDTSQWECSRL